jgi:hypothetical protein
MAERQMKMRFAIWLRTGREQSAPRILKGILANHSPDILMFDVPPPIQSKGIESYEDLGSVLFLVS